MDFRKPGKLANPVHTVKKSWQEHWQIGKSHKSSGKSLAKQARIKNACPTATKPAADRWLVVHWQSDTDTSPFTQVCARLQERSNPAVTQKNTLAPIPAVTCNGSMVSRHTHARKKKVISNHKNKKSREHHIAHHVGRSP
jgi:hypothetical protein